MLYNILQISLKEAAQPLLDSGVKTLSIGIGASVDKRELRAMVEYDQDVITAENFDQLIKNIKNITQQTCEQISKMLNFCDLYRKCHIIMLYNFFILVSLHSLFYCKANVNFKIRYALFQASHHATMQRTLSSSSTLQTK